jgi:hypothetical protein
MFNALYAALTLSLVGLVTSFVTADVALAGAPVPAPLAGALGPIGLIAVGAAYGGYVLVKKFRNR